MGFVCCDLFDQVGAWLQVSQENLTELVCLILADRLPIFECLKSDVGQCLLGLAVIFQNTKARLLFVHDGNADSVAGDNCLGIDRFVF